jgi:succinate dehydrogenase / fumarate reductase cytochrome b subunit
MSFFQSTIGKKVAVAATGLVMFGFVVGHLLGNLQIFQGPEKINSYSHFLKHTAALLWGTRIVLLFSVIIHVIFTIQLRLRNRAGRPVAYEMHEPQYSTMSARVMFWSGLYLLTYIVYHLLHFTFGSVHPRFSPTDVYANVIVGFSSWSVSLFYIVGMVCLGLHLHHGVWSVFQTLGLNHPSYNPWKKRLAIFSSIAIPLGYISIPAAVLAGILR